jgi:hypothetical protein
MTVVCLRLQICGENCSLKAVREKYAQDKYSNVSTIKPLALL